MLVFTAVLLGIVVLVLFIIPAFIASRRHKRMENKQEFPDGCTVVPISNTVKNRTAASYVAMHTSRELNELIRNTPPSPKEGEEIDPGAAFTRLVYPCEGKCGCRTARFGSYGILKDVNIRCERCGQPFKFQYPL